MEIEDHRFSGGGVFISKTNLNDQKILVLQRSDFVQKLSNWVALFTRVH